MAEAAIAFVATNAAAIKATAAVVTATAATASAVSSSQHRKRAAAAQRKQQQLQAQRSQRQAVREAQIRRAQTQGTSQGLGVVGGSALGGGLSSLSSQLGGSLGYAGQLSGLSKQISIASQKAQTADAAAGLGMQFFNAAGGFGAFGGGVIPPTEGQLLKGVGD